MKKSLHPAIIFSLFILSCSQVQVRTPADLEQDLKQAQIPIETLVIPKGYQISLYAVVPGARSLAPQEDGTLFVSTGGFSNPYDRVYRLKDQNGDGRISLDEMQILIEGLENPNGIALKNDDLYVGEISRIRRFKSISKVSKSQTLKANQGEILPLSLPNEGYHGWKYLKFKSETDWLYFAVGAPCNVCLQQGLFQKIYRFNVENHELQTVAIGQRNSVGFDFHPSTGNFWFTDNGRDLAGNNFPPDELNEVRQMGEDFGFPYCHGKSYPDHREQDPQFNSQGKVDCSKKSQPSLELNPHGAALGMTFIENDSWGTQFKGQVLIAEHGSWNREEKIGYQVGVTENLGMSNAKYLPFITGWLNSQNQKAWGRPVDVSWDNTGALLISDDGFRNSTNPGAIYRVIKSKGP